MSDEFFQMDFVQCFIYKDMPAVASSAIAVGQDCEASLVGGPETKQVY